MSLFDSIISEASERFRLGNKAGGLLAALLSVMTNQNRGGFAGFLDLFRNAGLSNLVSNWISRGANTELSNSQVVSALGNDTINQIADQANVSKDKATAALGYLIPNVVDRLTPDGTVPDERDLLSRIGDFLSGIGGAAAGAAAGAASTVSNTVGGAFNRAGNAVEDVADGGSSLLKWLIPLILLLLLLALGWMFCSKPTTPVATNTNTNTNKPVNTNTTSTAKQIDSSVNVTAKDGKYTITGVVPDQATKDKILTEAEATWGKGNVNVDGLKIDANAKPFAANWFDGFKNLLAGLKDWKDGTISWLGNTLYNAANLPKEVLSKIAGWFTGWTIPNTFKEISVVTLPNGTKLQAYPGGIEDQLVKFIQSDEYKNATPDSLKDKWFNFDDLNFKFGTTELDDKSKRQLDNIVAILKAFPDVKIKLGGYTDKKGDAAVNKKLSDDRAKAVKAALAKAGVGAQVPEAEGYGSEFATVAAEASDEERAVDRKTSVRLVKGDTTAAPANANAKPGNVNAKPSASPAKPAGNTGNTNTAHK